MKPDEKLTPSDLLEVYNAPARRQPERSYAQETKSYRDPSEAVKFEAERKPKYKPRS